MYRFVITALLFVGVGLGQTAAAQTASDLPARPVPFTFVTDQGNLLSATDAKKLEGGLRSYAEKTGTQVVVVTVPTLGSRSVADYGRALGTAWGVGQRDKNNGLVVLIGAKEHKVTIQPGSGLASTITPAVVSRVINQEMTPSFKQGNYFAGLRNGLNTLMVTANPSSAPSKQAAGAVSTAGATAAATSGELTDNPGRTASAMQSQMADPAGAQQDNVAGVPADAPSGPGMGTLLIGALVIGGILWFVIRMFRSRSAAQNGGSPNFYPNQGGNNRPNQNPGQPNFYPNQGGNPGPGYGGGYPNQGGSTGSGMGGILATGAAAAAGAYIGNRMSSHGDNDSAQHLSNNTDTSSLGAGVGAAGAAGTGAAGDYFAGRGGNDNATNDSPDYFSGNDTDNSNDYFSSDNSSYDDTSSGDTGGGGFDSTDDNSGSW
ncbi:TPM domain-containing protein [Hymenobacter cheonanensis]|uniref:TPM domain-containing protein n=1 Tax=Hymenobacter sp. CA2-7 TaxID=3063993 RepID=UPI0027141D0B|nr:TPM domain-containing protein [Hymenobacter sp. CA2-7]MDO7885526.1 TPM domain-containing protein [Hymenobacter sp. CA2-7]